MKVCHLSSAHGQEDTRIFHKECVSLANAGYEVYLITVGVTYDKKGVHIVGVRSIGNSRIRRMIITTKKVYDKAFEVDADVYHAHDPELLPILMKLKRKGKKVIFDSHEHTVGTIEEKEYIPKALRGFTKSIFELYQTYVCKKIDAVVTATPNITEYFLSLGCKRAIDLCNFPILSNAFSEPNYDSRCISYVGGISEQWNHDIIIKVLASFKSDIKYLLCGGGQEDYINKLQQFPGWRKVDYRGRIPFESVIDILKHSAIGMSLLTPGANTDWKNGNMANTKIFEQMMVGLPIICTNFVHWKRFVEKYDCGICVDPHDMKQIKHVIETLINDPAEARRKGLNGRHAVEEEFNWGREEKKLISLYAAIEGEIEND